jgi:hypothetical protein
VELAGRNWLASELLRAGLEVARPERDRGIDLIAYLDLDERVSSFLACPIQMKAATGALFQPVSKICEISAINPCLRLESWRLSPDEVFCFDLCRSSWRCR